MFKSLLQLAIAALAALVLWAAPAAAQRGGVLLNGTVLDNETEEPIPGAAIELLDRRRSLIARTVTNDDGRFRFVLPGAGGYRFRASRIGFRATNTPVLWTEDHDTLAVEIRLDAEAVLLAPLEVTAWARRVRPSPVLEGFRDRMASGLGHYFTREDIERVRPVLVSDMVGMVPGVELRSSGRGLRRQIFFGRTGDYCPAQVYVDGFLLNGRSRGTADQDFTLDDAVSPSSVEGIEVYRGLSSVPAQFLNADSRCGAIVVWTRRGGPG